MEQASLKIQYDRTQKVEIIIRIDGTLVAEFSNDTRDLRMYNQATALNLAHSGAVAAARIAHPPHAFSYEEIPPHKDPPADGVKR